MMEFIRGKTNWQRVTRANPCPICGRPDWCLFTGPADSPDAAICARTESPKRAGDGGWLHRLRDDDWRDRPRQWRVSIAEPPHPTIVFCALAEQYVTALSVRGLNALADDLGVTADSLERLRVGWSVQHRAFSFPMVDKYRQVRGIRLRSTDERKWSVKGGREGLFIASGVGPDDPFVGGGTLIICEGPSDTAALLDLGFSAVGRPSCMGGVELLVDLANDWHPDDVAIVADADAPGQRGARQLAARLVGYVPSGVRIVTPPAKDAREWVRHGATRDDVLDAIEAAPVITLSYKRRALA